MTPLRYAAQWLLLILIEGNKSMLFGFGNKEIQYVEYEVGNKEPKKREVKRFMTSF